MTIIFRNLLRRRVRTLLTIIGIGVGVTVIIALGALADGFKAGYGAMMRGSKADLVLSQPDTLDGAHADQLALAKSQFDAAQEAFDAYVVTAPFDGVVCNLNVRAGEWVMPGMPILQLGDLTSLRVETTDLSEIDAARVRADDLVLVTFDALPEVVVKGKVLWVAKKSAEGSGVNYTAVIVLDSIPDGLRWGMTAFVDIEVSP